MVQFGFKPIFIITQVVNEFLVLKFDPNVKYLNEERVPRIVLL